MVKGQILMLPFVNPVNIMHCEFEAQGRVHCKNYKKGVDTSRARHNVTLD